jgi:DNA-directed RNA polymerase specialized sigma24 family protein
MNTDDYAKRQKARDAEYEKAYRDWIESLPADERRELEAQGLAKPCLMQHGTGSATGDAADSPLMKEGDDPALLPPEPERESDSNPCDTESVWAALRRVLGEVLSHDNARLTAECIALVSGLSYTGCSMTEIASRHGITRAAVSKRCVELTELLDLPPSRAMRSLTARLRYREARLRNTQSHERSNAPTQRKGQNHSHRSPRQQ